MSQMMKSKRAKPGRRERELAKFQIKTPTSGRVRRVLDKQAPKLVEDGKKTLILHGTKTSAVLNAVLSEIYHLKKGSAVKFSKRNDSIRPFESGGEASLEFFSLKTDCSLFVFGSHSKKRPDNLVMGRTYDHHVYDLIEVGVENFRSLKSFPQDKKISPKEGTKPFIAFIGEGFETVEELKHLKEVLVELFRGQVVDNLNLVGLDRVYVCTAISANKVFLTHCALKLKKSGTVVPRIELVEVGPSMDLVVRRHRLPHESLRKEAIRLAPELHKKKVKNVKGDPIEGKIGKIYMPDQQVGEKVLPFIAKGMRREAKEKKIEDKEKKIKAKGLKRERMLKNGDNERSAKKQKGESESE